MKIETLSLAEARSLVSGAEAKAETIGRAMVIAVVGVDAYPILQVRMDGAWIGSIDIAVCKAFTAKAFDMPSADLWEPAQSGQPIFGIQHSNGGRVMAFSGGVPIVRNGQVVGAIGVSGGQGDEDTTVAEAALKALRTDEAR